MSRAVIVFHAADPDESCRLRLDEEVRAIDAQVRIAEYRDSLEFRTRWATRADDLLDSLNRDTPTVVHFGGHASDADGILLHDEHGNSRFVSGDILAELFGTAVPALRLVLLNACSTEDQAVSISSVVECCIGMTDAISDNAARTFAAAFYRAIAHGKSVENAFRQGTISLRLESMGEDQVPVLKCHSGVNPDSVFIVGSEKTSKQKRERWVVTLQGQITEFDLPALENITLILMSATGDQGLRIERVMEGSVRLVIQISEDGAQRLESFVRSELFEAVVGLGPLTTKPVVTWRRPGPLTKVLVRRSRKPASITRWRTSPTSSFARSPERVRSSAQREYLTPANSQALHS
jgi:CHAT domain